MKLCINCKKKEIKKKIKKALKIAFKSGQVDGAHHKMWVIDQMVRCLTGNDYEEWVKEYENGGEYEWDTGIIP